MAYIHERVFGSDISKPIKDKLTARQIGSKEIAPNESIDYNNNFEFNPGSNLDMSSRKPWARMWTAIRTYTVGLGKGAIEPDTSYGSAPDPGNVTSEQRESGYIKNYDKVVIYEMGNNIYNDYGQTKNPNEPIDSFAPYDFLTTNDFYKPQAGIIDIQSTTQGNLGIYVETVVNFRVYNFFDYTNIFSKFFLYPGAQIFIDMGWDTSEIYNQGEYFLHGQSDLTKFGGDYDFKGWKDAIFGFGGDQTDGLIAKSGGDLEVITGYVTDYTATSQPDGSFNCSITITSRNSALFSYEQKSRSNLGNLFNKKITEVIMDKLADEFFGDDPDIIKRLDFINRSETATSSASLYYKALLDKISNKNEISVGHQMEEHKFEESEDGGEWVSKNNKPYSLIRYRSIPRLSEEMGVYYQWTDDKSIPDGNTFDKFNSKTYINIKFLEDELLNKHLGIAFEGEVNDTSESNGDIVFNSNGQFVTFDQNLYMRQLTVKNYKDLNFLYPSFSDDSKPILIRNLWIRVSLIQDAFTNHSTVMEALIYLLEEISKDSFGIIKLSLSGGSGTSDIVKIVDINSPIMKSQTTQDNLEKTEEELGDIYNFHELFTFKPYTDKSLISNMNLSLKMPSNTMSSVLAINATSLDKQIYSNSREFTSLIAMKDLHVENKNKEDVDSTTNSQESEDDGVCDGSLEGAVGFEWLPILSEEITDRVNIESVDTIIDDIISPDNNYDGDSEWIKFFTFGYYSGDPEDEAEKAYNAVIAEIEDSREKLESSEFVFSGSGGKYKLANSIEEFFRFKLESESISVNGQTSTEGRTNMVLPYTLNLSIYGISGILPGNVFRLDYLPEIYRNKIVFIVEKVGHHFTSGGWITTIDAYTMYRADKLFKCGFSPKSVHITWNPKLLFRYGYSEDRVRHFIENPNESWWTEIPNAVSKVRNEIKQKETKNLKTTNPYDHGINPPAGGSPKS
jgi:hypothetical protein